MRTLVEAISISGESVIDTGTVVLSTRDTTVELIVEGMPVRISFAASEPTLEPTVTMQPDGAAVEILVSRPVGSGAYTFSGRHFAQSDDNRSLSLNLYIDEVAGPHGQSRLLAYTITAAANG